MTQSDAQQDQQHLAAYCCAPAAAIEAAVDWSSWTDAIPVMAQLVWRRQQHCWLLQHWKVALLADLCPCPAAPLCQQVHAGTQPVSKLQKTTLHFFLNNK